MCNAWHQNLTCICPPHNLAAYMLTGWTNNAVSQCFCDKCGRAFKSDVSVLQHFKTSPHHQATVEALEANTVLCGLESSQVGLCDWWAHR